LNETLSHPMLDKPFLLKQEVLGNNGAVGKTRLEMGI
jgi:hypothetical protein